MSDGIKVLDVSELTDYGKQILETATKEMPKIARSFLKGEANHLKNKAKKKAKGELKSFNNKPPKEGEITREYLHNFTSGKVYPYGDTEYNIQVKNTAPHAHWIESGHNMVTIDGRTVGFIPGKHILENSAIEFESTFAKDIENKLAKKVIKELEK